MITISVIRKWGEAMGKNTSINILFDSEKLAALNIYLNEKGTTLEDEMSAACESLYQKTVPSTVRSFIDLRSGEGKTNTKKKPKPTAPNVSDGSDGS